MTYLWNIRFLYTLMYKLIWVIIVVIMILLTSFLYQLQLCVTIYLLCGSNLVSLFILREVCQI